MNTLHVENLNVTLDKFSLTIKKLLVKEGSILHIKGKNGIGKTVFLNTLMGFMNYTGKLEISTKDVTGFINNDTLIPYLYPIEYLKYLKKISNNDMYLENYKSISELFKFDINEKKYIRDLSEGNKKKIGLISILSLESDLMIFDEPYAYLDDFSCGILDDLFISKNANSTILFSSHQETKITTDYFDLSEHE